MSNYPRSVDWFRSMGPVISTRFPELHVWRQAPDLWRILVTDTCGDTSETGDLYASRHEVMADLATIHSSRVGAPVA